MCGCVVGCTGVQYSCAGGGAELVVGALLPRCRPGDRDPAAAVRARLSGLQYTRSAGHAARTTSRSVMQKTVFNAAAPAPPLYRLSQQQVTGF